MIIIEFLGLPGSGKTFLKKKLISKYFSSFNIYDYRTLYFKFKEKNILIKIYFFLIKSNFFKKLKKYFKIKTKQNSYLNFFFQKYSSNVQTIFNKNLKYKNQLKNIKYLIQNSNFNDHNKKTFLRWAQEELSSFNLAKSFNKKKGIIIESEGLIQRLLIYCNKKKNKKKIINGYLNTINLPDILIIFKKNFKKKSYDFKLNRNDMKKTLIIIEQELKKRRIITLSSDIGVDKIYHSIQNYI